MPWHTVYTSVRLAVSWDEDAGSLCVVVTDEYGQRETSYVFPDHLLPALRDALSDVIERRPDLFPVTHTRRID